MRLGTTCTDIKMRANGTYPLGEALLQLTHDPNIALYLPPVRSQLHPMPQAQQGKQVSPMVEDSRKEEENPKERKVARVHRLSQMSCVGNGARRALENRCALDSIVQADAVTNRCSRVSVVQRVGAFVPNHGVRSRIRSNSAWEVPERWGNPVVFGYGITFVWSKLS